MIILKGLNLSKQFAVKVIFNSADSFDNKVTFVIVNSQHKPTSSKVYFAMKRLSLKF